MSADGLRGHIATVANGAVLTEADAYDAFSVIMSGEATPSQIGGLLMGLRVRGGKRRGDYRRCAGYACANDDCRCA